MFDHELARRLVGAQLTISGNYRELTSFMNNSLEEKGSSISVHGNQLSRLMNGKNASPTVQRALKKLYPNQFPTKEHRACLTLPNAESRRKCAGLFRRLGADDVIAILTEYENGTISLN